MRVVVSSTGVSGDIGAVAAADAVVAGWRSVRPGDDLVAVVVPRPGAGLLDVVTTPADHRAHVEVAGPHGHPVDAEMVLRSGGMAVIEAARASGPDLVPIGRRAPVSATTYGVGQLLDAARRNGAGRVVVAVGDVAAVDGGSGALTGLGFRLRVGDGSGLKIGGDDLRRVAGVGTGWSADWRDVEVVLLADAPVTLGDAAANAGPAIGASDAEVADLAAGLETWAEVAERDLRAPGRRDEAGTGAGGGLAFGLACALPTVRVLVGSAATAVVAELVGAAAAVARADLVVLAGGGGGDGAVGEIPSWLGDLRGIPVVAAGPAGSGSDLAAAAADLASRNA